MILAFIAWLVLAIVLFGLFMARLTMRNEPVTSLDAAAAAGTAAAVAALVVALGALLVWRL